MLQKLSLVFLFVFIIGNTQAQQALYKDSKQSVAARTADLLSRMTLEEKVGQLLCPLGWPMYQKKGTSVGVSQKFKDAIAMHQIGMLWATYRADPWTEKTIANGLNPETAAKVGNDLQRYILENTRLGIPIFLAEEAPHGHMAIGTTVFPTGIGQAATWNTNLLENMGQVIAKEIRAQGAHISYGPVLDLARDPRWSRVEEGYGEDPVLAGKLGAAIVKGTGGGNLKNPYATVATLKALAAYGYPEGGHNGAAATVGEREFRQFFLTPFEMAAKAGARSAMSAYNSIDGIPSTANKHLLTDILRTEWGFDGFVVSDLGSVEGIKSAHRVAKNYKEAAILAIKAGVDVDLGGNAFPNLIEAVKQGEIDEQIINQAVTRVLALKFEMGLFENPYVAVNQVKKSVKTPDNVRLAEQIAKESITLLENKNQLLPLKKGTKIALIGPNADNVYNLLGDYTAPQTDGSVITVLQGLQMQNGKSLVSYAKGCAIRDTSNTHIPEAVKIARQADVIVAVVGGSSARDFKTEYIATGAAKVTDKNVSDMDNGEGFDRATLDLLGKQLDLLKALKKTGKPLVVVYIQGRPLNMNWAAKNADALLCAWYPGSEGGKAIADVLLGNYNPGGRLPISVPRSVGQIPVHYNQKNSLEHHYTDELGAPLYVFGYGKSYTTFNYTDLKVQKKENGFQVSFTLTNTGKLDGDEVPQLYIKDRYASVSQPIIQLKNFKRVSLKAGESTQIEFKLSKEDLSIINTEMKEAFEPNGSAIISIGAASNQIKLQQAISW